MKQTPQEYAAKLFEDHYAASDVSTMKDAVRTALIDVQNTIDALEMADKILSNRGTDLINHTIKYFQEVKQILEEKI